MTDDEPKALLVLLALATTLYVLAWLVTQPMLDHEISDSRPEQEAPASLSSQSGAKALVGASAGTTASP